MNYKVFTDEENPTKEMQVYLSKDNTCFICCEDNSNDDYYCTKYVSLTYDDLVELISELQLIKKQIEENG